MDSRISSVNGGMATISKAKRFARNHALNEKRSGPAEPPLDVPGVGAYTIPSSFKIEYGTSSTFGQAYTDRGSNCRPI